MKPKKCVVVGGGNVAMDAARTALRLGSEVHVVYRRGEEELPARREEVEHAKQEGIIFDLLTNPIEILSDEKVFSNPVIFHGAITWNDGAVDIAPETVYKESYAYDEVAM